MSSGSFSPKMLDVPELIMSLWGGLFFWEIIQSLPLDWRIITGKRGCLWGAVIFYFPFRIVAAVSFATGILAAYPLPEKQSEAVGYIQQSTNLVSRVIVFHILSIRISQIWKHRVISYGLFVIVVALEILSLYGISRIRGVWYGTVMPSTLAIFFLCLATAFLIFTIVGLFRARSIGNLSPPGDADRYSDKSMWYIMWKERIYLIVIIWITQTVSSLTWLCGPKASDAMTVIGMSNALTILLCGGRIFQHMFATGSACPIVYAPSIVATLLRSQCGAWISEGFPTRNLRRVQKRREPASQGRSICDGRISIQLPRPEDHKDVIQLQTFARDALPSTSRVSLKTTESFAPSSSSDIRICKRTPSPTP